MIIKFVTTTIDPRNEEEKTFWFSIKLQNAPYTSYDVGLNDKRQWVSASKEVYDLDESTKSQMISEVVTFAAKVI